MVGPSKRQGQAIATSSRHKRRYPFEETKLIIGLQIRLVTEGSQLGSLPLCLREDFGVA